MAKRFVILAAMLAAMLALAVPAFAQEEVSVTGVIEEQGQKADGTAVYSIADEATGEAYYLETATGESPGDLLGRRVTAYGTVRNDSGQILTADRIELVGAQQQQPAEELSVTGVLEEQGARADGTPAYGVVDETSGQGYVLEGDFDFAALVGQRVTAYGAYEAGGGAAILNVLSIEPEDEGGTTVISEETTTTGATTAISEETTTGGETMISEETIMGGTTMGTTTGPAEERYEDGGTPEQVGIDVNEDGVVNEADGEFAAQTSQEGVANTPDEGALPGTGGLVLPVAGLAGALLVAGGLLLRNRLAR